MWPKKNGISFLVKRPKNLSSDESGKIPAIRHCLKVVENKIKGKFNYVFDLDVTSPLRSILDILEVKKIILQQKYGNVLTVTPARESPYFNLLEYNGNGYPLAFKKIK